MRTSRASLQPWEMTCIVAGFPSNIAALQFEWAWHNAHLTRHIPQGEKMSLATTRVKTVSKTGKAKRGPGRPRTSLMDKLSNLHLLLRAPYFSHWPLEVRFFCQDIFGVWQTWCERVDGQIRPGITQILDMEQKTPIPQDWRQCRCQSKQASHRQRGADWPVSTRATKHSGMSSRKDGFCLTKTNISRVGSVRNK